MEWSHGFNHASKHCFSICFGDCLKIVLDLDDVQGTDTKQAGKLSRPVNLMALCFFKTFMVLFIL